MKTGVSTPVFALVTLAFIAGLVIILVTGGGELPDAPVTILWDKEPCAECRMLVGEASYAAQVQLKDGTIHNFDDPGCALRWLGRAQHDLHAVYFHHVREERWLRAEQTAFLTGFKTPMGSGLGAVDVLTPATITRDEASELIAAQEDMP